MMLDLIKIGLGAGIGAGLTFALTWRWFRNYSEYEAYASYLVGFASGRGQGRSDAKRAGVVWTRAS